MARISAVVGMLVGTIERVPPARARTSENPVADGGGARTEDAAGETFSTGEDGGAAGPLPLAL